MGKAIILNEGERFGYLTVVKYIGNATHLCVCDCGNTCNVKTKLLRNNGKKSCGCKSNNTKIDMEGMTIGEWKVLGESETPGYWRCRCSCGVIKDVNGHELRRGNTKSCGHNRVIGDLTNKVFGEWTVLCRANTDRYWTCKCSCGEIKDVQDYSLVHHKSTSCGHQLIKYNQYKAGDTFGELTIIRQIKNQLFEFQCSCGNTQIYNINSVVKKVNGTKSCGCKSNQLRINTIIKTKGDFKTSGDARELWQIEILSDRDKFIKYLECADSKSSREEIADKLGVTRTGLYEAAQRFNVNLNEYIDARNRKESPEETEVYNYIKSIYNGKIICNSRKVINPQEVDIYIPDKKLAIEFNGDYWHSEQFKDKYYHQNKTIECAKRGVRLIHIFEHEWSDINIQNKLKKLLSQILCSDNLVLYGRKTTIKEVDKHTASDFCNKYHLQGYSNCDIAIGCYHGENIIGIMTFGKPRFNRAYNYEIVRLCWKDGIAVIGGTQKMFNYFINKYKPSSIITYADISKFTGNIYTKLGFKWLEITKPNYKWINLKSGDIISRYQAQKSKLIKLNIAVDGDTEVTAMQKIGYYRVYDSGNLKLEWSNTNG